MTLPLPTTPRLNRRQHRSVTAACLRSLTPTELLVYSRLPLGEDHDPALVKNRGQYHALSDWEKAGKVPYLYLKRVSRS